MKSSPELEKSKELTDVAQSEASLTETIAKSVTAKVMEAIESLPDTEVDEDVDLAEQEKALNEIDEADAVHTSVVSAETPTTISTPTASLQLPQAVLLSPEDVMILRAALRADLMHVVTKVLSLALEQ